MEPTFIEFVPDGGEGEEEESIYGFPLTSNPLDFFPDYECCTPEEIAAWEADCARAKEGDAIQNPRAGSGTGYDEKGNMTLHVTATRWGIGTSILRQSR